MATISQKIQFLRRCYEADNRESGIKDLLHKKNRHVRFFDGQELAVSGTLGRAPLPRDYGEKLRKDALKFRRDKSLVYAAFPIVGAVAEKRQLGASLCAPLLYCAAEVVEDRGNLFVSPDLDNVRFNMPVLEALQDERQSETESYRVFSELKPPPWPRAEVHSLAAKCAEILPEIDWTPLSSFPDLRDSLSVRRAVEEGGDLRCLPAAAVALCPNSPDTRGVLFELSQLQDATQHSPPLEHLLQQASRAVRVGSREPALAPTVLSRAQTSVLKNARSQPLSIVVGPPGTGKSHTIAAVALDHLARGQSVLVASRMDQAVDVVGRKIEEQLGDSHAIIRAGRKNHKRELKRHLENLLQGIHQVDSGTSVSGATRQMIRRLDRRIAKLESSLERKFAAEITWGNFSQLGSAGWNPWAHLSRFWNAKSVANADTWGDIERLNEMVEQRQQQVCRLLQTTLAERTQKMLQRYRSDLSSFVRALSARSDGKQQELFSEVNFTWLLHAFPVWLCKLSDLANVLPHRQGLFDLAILDEATQCDISSCLPLLQRARRAVIVGDPKQLRHLSFLPKARSASIADACGLNSTEETSLNYRTQSILDLASEGVADQRRVSFLNEHFRSKPQIIEFSNREFYAGALSIMRQRPVAEQPDDMSLRPVQGSRGRAGYNSEEVDAIAGFVKRLVADQAGLNLTHVTSLGVLSPFRDQVEKLAARLDKEMTYEQMQRHDLLVGTAHTFQGEERDLMCVSLAADESSHAATFRFLENPELLNVAITRARHRQLVFHSFAVDSLQPGSLLRRWLEFAQQPTGYTSKSAGALDRFRDMVERELVQLGIKVWKDFPVAGIQLDVLLECQGQMLGIDLVGYPGVLQEAYDLERYRVLRRSGLQLFPLSYRQWQQDSGQFVQRIAEALRTSALNQQN